MLRNDTNIIKDLKEIQETVAKMLPSILKLLNIQQFRTITVASATQLFQNETL
jgi:hypothetical protein